MRNMSSKNAIKIINIQKFYSVYFVLLGPLWFYSVHIGPILSTLILFCPFCPLRSTLVLFCPLWSYSVYSVHIGLILSTLVLFSHISPIQSILFTLIHFSLIQAIQSSLVLFGLFCQLWFYSVHFGLAQSTLVLFGPIRSITSTLVLICTFILWSTLVLFSLLWSPLVLFSPHWSSIFFSVQFGPLCSHSVLFCPCYQLLSIWPNAVHLCPLCALTYREKLCLG